MRERSLGDLGFCITEGTEDGSFRGLGDSRLVPGFPPVLDDRWQRQGELKSFFFRAARCESVIALPSELP
jgi:hypothetical protein